MIGIVPCIHMMTIFERIVIIMSHFISRTDKTALHELSFKHGARVKFGYVDRAGKATDVDTEVDSTTVLPDSILTNSEANGGYKRYLFSSITTDVEVDD